MRIPTEGKLLRIFIGEQDQWQGQPLYEAIVHLARKMGLAGATAIKGFMGFGCKSHMHTAKLLRLSEDLPVIIEIIEPKACFSIMPACGLKATKRDEMMPSPLVSITNSPR